MKFLLNVQQCQGPENCRIFIYILLTRIDSKYKPITGICERSILKLRKPTIHFRYLRSCFFFNQIIEGHTPNPLPSHSLSSNQTNIQSIYQHSVTNTPIKNLKPKYEKSVTHNPSSGVRGFRLVHYYLRHFAKLTNDTTEIATKHT